MQKHASNENNDLDLLSNELYKYLTKSKKSNLSSIKYPVLATFKIVKYRFDEPYNFTLRKLVENKHFTI